MEKMKIKEKLKRYVHFGALRSKIPFWYILFLSKKNCAV